MKKYLCKVAMFFVLACSLQESVNAWPILPLKDVCKESVQVFAATAKRMGKTVWESAKNNRYVTAAVVGTSLTAAIAWRYFMVEVSERRRECARYRAVLDKSTEEFLAQNKMTPAYQGADDDVFYDCEEPQVVLS